MEKRGRPVASQKTAELDLSTCRIEQIFAADHVRDTLQPVVYDDRKLIRPVAVAIAEQEIAALLRGTLLLRAEPAIVKSFDGRLEPHANATAGGLRQMLVATRPWISRRADFST